LGVGAILSDAGEILYVMSRSHPKRTYLPRLAMVLRRLGLTGLYATAHYWKESDHSALALSIFSAYQSRPLSHAGISTPSVSASFVFERAEKGGRFAGEGK